MGLFTKRSGLRREAGEKELGWSLLTTDPPTGPMRGVATSHRVVILRERENGWEQVWQRRWHEVDSASWDREEYSLVIRAVSGDNVRVVVPESGDLGWPATVHARVESSVITWRTVDVPGGEVRLVVRQRHDGSLLMQVQPGPDVDVGSPSVRRTVADARRALGAEVGQPDL